MAKSKKSRPDAAGHRAELVERPAQCHRAGAGHASKRRPQSGNAAPHRRRDDAAAGFAADREADQSGRGRGARTRARSGRAFLEQPRVHRLPAEPDVVERQRAQAQFRDQDGAGVVEAPDDRGVGGRHAVPVRLRTIRRGDAGRVEQILDAIRDAMQRPAIASSGDFRVGFLRLRERGVFVSVMTERSFDSNCSIRRR